MSMKSNNDDDDFENNTKNNKKRPLITKSEDVQSDSTTKKVPILAHKLKY